MPLVPAHVHLAAYGIAVQLGGLGDGVKHQRIAKSDLRMLHPAHIFLAADDALERHSVLRFPAVADALGAQAQGRFFTRCGRKASLGSAGSEMPFTSSVSPSGETAVTVPRSRLFCPMKSAANKVRGCS